MSPALKGNSYVTGDRVLAEKITSWLRSPRRWEIWLFYNSEGTAVAKRIVGLPGEKIAIRENKLFINGGEVTPPSGIKPPKYYAYGSLAQGRRWIAAMAFSHWVMTRKIPSTAATSAQ